MTKTEELLKVLDMPEEEQLAWIAKAFFENDRFAAGCHLADLAFRLRDEVSKKELNEGAIEVLEHYAEGYQGQGDMLKWFAYYAKPIHWIIAALIAKQKEKPECQIGQ